MMRVVAMGLCLALAGPAWADELDALARSVDERPEDPKAYDEYAKAALKAKRYDDVIRKVKIGTARLPDYTQGYYWLALAYRSRREWPDAADYYRRYIEKNPSKADPYFGLGASLEGLGDKKGAISAYEKYVGLEKAPEKQRFVEIAKAELAKLKGAAAPPTAAPAAPVQAATPQPPPPPAPRGNATQLRGQAEQLRKEGKLEESARAYQQAIEADRGNVELYNELGNVWFALKRYDEAATAFREAIGRDPSYALGWYNLAHALRKGDRKKEAVDAYRAYMRLKPDDPDPYYGLGQTLKALGDVPGAIDAFRKYVAMEKRPDEQRWVEKARTELELLEAMQRSPSGKLEEKKGRGSAAQARAPGEPLHELDGLMNPFETTDRDGLSDSFGEMRLSDLKDPFRQELLSTAELSRALSAGAAGRKAIEVYLGALSRRVEKIAEQIDAARRSVDQLRHVMASRR
jgi:tetratricopeptide (TPR) repeat protein